MAASGQIQAEAVDTVAMAVLGGTGTIKIEGKAGGTAAGADRRHRTPRTSARCSEGMVLYPGCRLIFEGGEQPDIVGMMAEVGAEVGT